MTYRLTEEMDCLYFEWLADLVKNRNHWDLLEYLHSLEFYGGVGNDDDRARDGIALRSRFNWEDQYNLYVFPREECSVLEFLIGVASRLDANTIGFEEHDRLADWFWDLLRNLNLDAFTDKSLVRHGGYDAIDDILVVLLERKYDYNGVGGLFPLDEPSQDQRELEIWYQMNEYILENDP